MKCIYVNIIIVIVLFFMQSCIREDLAECNESALRLRFRYIPNNQYLDVSGSDVHQITVYIFDADGKYVGAYSKTGDKLINDYIMTIPLEEGKYQVIVFCNNINTFSAGWTDNLTNLFYSEFKPQVTEVKDFRIMLNSTEGPEGFLIPESLPGNLYAGYIRNAPSTYNTSYITDVDLTKDTKNIKVKISGLNYLTRSATAPEIYITAVNGRYKNDNSIDTSHGMLKYTPHNTSVTGNTMSSDLKTMRLVIGHRPMLVIKHSSTPGYVFNRDITEMILSNPKYVSQEDIDKEDIFVFEINISQTDNNKVISISINGWEINTVIPVND